MRLARFLVASIATLAVGSFGNFAIGQTWEGDSTLDAPLFYYWSDGSNWLLDTVPTSSSTALFVNNGANSKNIDFAGGANIANGVRFAAGSSAYTFRPFSGVGLQLQGSNSFLENLGGNNQQINAGVTFSGAGSKTISATSTGGLQFGGSVSNTAASALTISKSGTGAIAFTGSLTSNAGLAITNSNATGNVTIGNATVSGSTVSVGGTGATSFTGTLTNAAGVLTLTKAGTGTLSTSGISSAAGVSISNSGTGVTTIGSISNTSGNVAISNSAAATLNVGAITGGGNLQITNSDATGVVRLNNNVGASTVSFSGGGRVEVASGVTVNGSTAVSGAGSSLTGLGSFGNSVVIQNGGTLSPGVSGAGSLAFNGGLAFDSGSTFSWDLVNTTTGFDTVAVSGGSGLSINSGATSVLNISNAIDASFWNTNQSWNVFTGTFAAPGSVFGNITLAGAAPDVTKGFFTWSSSTNGVTLNFTAVPEPSSMALLGLAGVIGGAYARRRNKLAKRLTAAC